ncbi:hypothetical protein HDV63DRAFT_379397 [Trichoderma sp. SZMC 28014]
MRIVISPGTALSGGLFIAHIMVGGTVIFVITGLGELTTFLPMNKGFAGNASCIVDPAFGSAET